MEKEKEEMKGGKNITSLLYPHNTHIRREQQQERVNDEGKKEENFQIFLHLRLNITITAPSNLLLFTSYDFLCCVLSQLSSFLIFFHLTLQLQCRQSPHLSYITLKRHDAGKAIAEA